MTQADISTNHSKIKREIYLYLLLPVMFFTILLSWGFYQFESNSRLLITKASTENHVDLQIQTISLSFKQIISDLRFLSKQQGLMNYLNNPDSVNQQHLANDYLSFSINKNIYDQIRFLDKTGQERIRVNYNNGKPQIVDENKLQNKGKRYYFMDAFKLTQGEIFVSPFDLNMEKGKIEKPLKPMIRFGMPVFDENGIKRGIILLNYLGKDLLNRFRNEAKELSGTVLLLNRDGYSLSSNNPENDWAFMYVDNKNNAVAKQYSYLWKEISLKPRGQYKVNGQLITYSTVTPLEEKIISSSGSASAFASSQKQLGGKDYFWKIVSIIKKDDAELSSQNIIFALLSFSLFIGLISLVGSWILANSKIKLALKVEELEKTQKQLIQSETMASLGRMVAGFAHEINTPVGIAVGASSQIEATLNSFEDLLNQDEEDEVDEEEIIKHFKTLRQATRLEMNNLNRAANLITSFKRTSVNQSSNQPRMFLPAELIQDVLNTLKNKLKRSDIQINVSCTETLKVYGQPGLLDQIITNFIINSFNHAFDFGKKTGIIDIIVNHKEDNLLITFQDNGLGMDKATQDKIFEPFFTTDRKEGTGLGLYLCYNIITSELKGQISCQSEQGKGTRYQISFPVSLQIPHP